MSSCLARIRTAKRKRKPRCVVIAGPNGAGKTTFARRYLPENARVIHFVNADLIASGLSPLRPELAAIAAARVFSKCKEKGVLHISEEDYRHSPPDRSNDQIDGNFYSKTLCYCHSH